MLEFSFKKLGKGIKKNLKLIKLLFYFVEE